MSDCEVTGAQSKLSNICGLILYFFVLIGPLKPEVEEEKSPNAILVKSCAFLTPLVFPPRAQRSPPGHPPWRTIALLKSIQILIVF